MNKTKKIELKIAESKADFEAGKDLFQEYSKNLNLDLCFQNFEKELTEINKQYKKSLGGLILLKYGDRFIGCVGIRKHQGQIAELKRMYIVENFRRKGFGKKLLDSAIELSKELKYKKIRLDTLESMRTAIKLYESYGFKEIAP